MSLQNNELRRGNLIRHVHDPKHPEANKGFFKVYEIRPSSFSADKGDLGFSFFYADAEGIPLTPELLQKLGFVQDGFFSDAPAWRRENDMIANEWFHKILGRTAVILNYKMKYLHQLQNLWFAMYGEELETKDL